MESQRRTLVRFAGDSGDGSQLVGRLLGVNAAQLGAQVTTVPDFPAEIRAPAGALYGVSAYSLAFGEGEVWSATDSPDLLIAFNPAAYETHAPSLSPTGRLIIDAGAFTERNLVRAKLGGSITDLLAGFAAKHPQGSLLEPDMTATLLHLAKEKSTKANRRNILRARNFWALGLVLGLLDQGVDRLAAIVEQKFNEPLRTLNLAALRAGWAYVDIHELPPIMPRLSPSPVSPMVPPRVSPVLRDARTSKSHPTITSGTEAIGQGLIQAANLLDRNLFFASYPITPSSPLLHWMDQQLESPDVVFQAEDELAALASVTGAAFAGALGVTSTSGPGLSLMSEGLGLAVSAELPMLIIDIQRGGPSTGLPTRTEQSDLLQAVSGRHGDAPLPVIAIGHPRDATTCILEAARMALEAMTPVIILADAQIANMATSTKTTAHSDPQAKEEEAKTALERARKTVEETAQTYLWPERNPQTLAPAWTVPGRDSPIRLTGLEVDRKTGSISYEGTNHNAMTQLRAAKIEALAKNYPATHPLLGNDALEPEVTNGAKPDELLVIGWGSTYGALREAALEAREAGLAVAYLHLRNLAPLPPDLAACLNRYPRVLVVEQNSGQLRQLLQGKLGRLLLGYGYSPARPFLRSEIRHAINAALAVDITDPTQAGKNLGLTACEASTLAAETTP